MVGYIRTHEASIICLVTELGIMLLSLLVRQEPEVITYNPEKHIGEPVRTPSHTSFSPVPRSSPADVAVSSASQQSSGNAPPSAQTSFRSDAPQVQAKCMTDCSLSQDASQLWPMWGQWAAYRETIRKIPTPPEIR